MSELERRQEKFCVELVSDPKRNQTQAAIRAGYSERSARITASQLMKDPKIITRIKELEREAIEECGYSAEAIRTDAMRKIHGIASTDLSDIAHVVYENDERRKAALAQMAESNNGQFLLDFGDALLYIKPTDEWTMEQRAAIKSIKMGKGGIEIEQYDKLAAYRILLEAFKTGADVNINLNITDALNEARQRTINECE